MKDLREGLRGKVEELEQVEKRSRDQQRHLESQIRSLNQMKRKTSDTIKKLFIREEVLRRKKHCGLTRHFLPAEVHRPVLCVELAQ